MQALSLAEFVLDGWKELAQSKIVHHERDGKGKSPQLFAPGTWN
jgi:hypothetical protein